MESQPKTVLTPDELARRWRCRTGQIYRLVQEGVLAAPAVFYIGRLLRISTTEVEKLEASGGVRFLGGWKKEPARLPE